VVTGSLETRGAGVAIIADGRLGMEIRLRSVDSDQSIEYDIRFLWQGGAIVRQEVMKAGNDYWSRRLDGGFRASDHGGDTLIPALRSALDHSTAGYWEPVEPWISLYFAPGITLDDLPILWKCTAGEPLSQPEESYVSKFRARLRDDKAKQSWMLVARVDGMNFSGEDTFSVGGPALVIQVDREPLQQFVHDLEREYVGEREEL
jgi:hypothetical protein